MPCTMNLNILLENPGSCQRNRLNPYAFDGYIPQAVVLPGSVREIQDVLRFAAKQDLSVMPAGAGTKLGIGNLPQKVDVLLTTTRLNNVIEYEPADLTVTVEAGVSLAVLQAELAKYRQLLSLNPPLCSPKHHRWNCCNKCKRLFPPTTWDRPKSGLGVAGCSRKRYRCQKWRKSGEKCRRLRSQQALYRCFWNARYYYRSGSQIVPDTHTASDPHSRLSECSRRC